MPVILRLAIPCPLRRLFDYLPPADEDPEAAAQLAPGCRLRVPFGTRSVVGFLVEVDRHPAVDPDALRAAEAILDRQSPLSPGIAALCRWAAHYYLHPPGEVYSAAYSKRLREGRAPLREAWRLTDRGHGLPPDALARAPRQAAALAALRTAPAMSEEALLAAGVTGASLRELARKGLAERCAATAAPARIREAGPPPNPEQGRAVDAIVAGLGSFRCHLLEGVTGSGKTEVYLRAIAGCLERGRQALVLVPEIGLTPQTVARFAARFDARIALLHSGLAAGERSAAWAAAAAGAAQVVIGTRSAVFTPLAQPGIIIVDEEHDASFHQQDGFRYSARDVAVKRGQLEHCPVVLGSATPSLESLHNVRARRYALHRLTRRAGGAALPSIHAVDVRRQPLQAGLSPALLEAASATLESGRQVLLFLNRRGYASSLQCHSCGWVAGCDHCDARLTVHRRQRQLRCHHCAARRPLPAACPVCGGSQLLTGGLGTEQAEDFLRRKLDRWPLLRVDSDAIPDHGAMQALLAEVARGEPCILLGTQMLTKGHHFPAVALVGVIDCDALLFSADFRGEERLAQLLTQVAGRAGRAAHPGRMLLQTHYPDHPLLQALLCRPYDEVAGELLARRLQAGMPPAGRLAMLRADTPAPGAGEAFLAELRRLAAPHLPTGCRLIGPLPSAMPRRAGRFRSQLACLSEDRRAAAAGAAALVNAGEGLRRPAGLNWFIEIDPLETL
jgi:primosomal protein N' (replication factor Y)